MLTKEECEKALDHVEKCYKENIEEFRNIVGDERIKKYFFGAFE